MELNYIDIAIAILLAYGIIKGLINGFIIELASIAALILGVWGAIHFSDAVGVKLSEFVDWGEKNISIAAFIITFAAIVIAVSFLGKGLTQIVSMVFLGWLNRLLGALFGLLKMAFVLSVLLMIFNYFNSKFDFVDDKELDNSKLYWLVAPVAPSVIPYFDDLDFDELWKQSYNELEEHEI